MGRIGKSYPRSGADATRYAGPGEPEESFAARATGALLGILAALGLIGWLLTR
jgi:hypothetical protein